jgi:Flp pilus assembly CpaF family ATPase
LATAKKIALQNAKTELAANIQSTIKAVTDNYTNQISVADKQEFENKFEELQRAVVNQELNDVHVIGEKVFKEKDGKYTYYIAIEMSKESIEHNIADRISKDAKLKLDFDKFQYQKIFDEEMKKFENQ